MSLKYERQTVKAQRIDVYMMLEEDEYNYHRMGYLIKIFVVD